LGLFALDIDLPQPFTLIFKLSKMCFALFLFEGIDSENELDMVSECVIFEYKPCEIEH